MIQASQISGSIICKKVIFLMILCLILIMLPLGFARENSNHFAFNGLNGISNKSDSMFYNDNHSVNGKSPAPFTASVGRKLADGVEVTATGSQYPVKLIPLTLSQGMGTRTGNRITYTAAPGVQIIYTFKTNGVKEDIVLDHPSAAPVEFSFRLELDPMLDARLDKKGNILIYGPNSVLSGFIQTGDAKSAELILKARQHAAKDTLLYIIPAPVIIDGVGIKHKNIAHYTLNKSILTIHADGLANVPAPVSIDPSIVVTTTADFMTGNNEGMISFDTDAISRAVPSGGLVGIWSATTSFPSARYGHTSIAYNGYLYVIGGFNGSAFLNDVQFAPINANGTIGSWTATTSFLSARDLHTSVAYNGYLYVLGGYDGSIYLNDVQFAPINANGTIGSWTTTTSFTTARLGHTSVSYNGYLYVLGGYDGSAYMNDVQFAPVNGNGTVGSWSATTSFTTARIYHTSLAYNGYLYVIGGYGTTYLNDVQFASLNTNGTVGSWTATTSFIVARRSHASVAYNGYLYVIGGTGISTNLNDVQFAPVNGNGTVGSWTATANFVTGRYFHTSVVYNGNLYVLGGYYISGYLNDVQFAPINGNGTVGAWTATTSFTTASSCHTSVVYNGYLYVLGGYTSTGPSNTVQFAPINDNGTIGSWSATNSFTTARYCHTSVAYNGYLYVIGGYSTTYLSDVQYAAINGNGTVGTWTATTSFTTARTNHTSVAYNGYLYVIGGQTGSGGALNNVQFAPINTNGTIGTWTATTSFTTVRLGQSSVVYSGYLYVLGGNNLSGYLNDVQFAPINANGTIGSWTATTSFTTARYGHTSIAYNGYLYLMGGASSAYFNDVQFAPINTNGTIGSWTATTSFTTVRGFHTSVIYNAYLYVLGGSNVSGYLNDVQSAPVNPNGTLSAWAATTSFTTARHSHTSVAYNGYLYVIAGSNGSYLNDVQFAPVNPNGTIGAWTATTSIPSARGYHASVAYNGYLYVLGGSNGSYLNDVLFAPINANGTVGAWSTTTSFTTARYSHASLAYNGYLYVIGGFSGSYLNDVQFAPINANGTIGTWTATTSFTTGRAYHTSVVYNGYLYVIGGYNGSISFNDVQFAPVNSNGTVGTWAASTGLISARYLQTSVAYNGYLYVIGGYGGWYLNDVQFAPINSNGTIGAWTATTRFTTARMYQTSAVSNSYVYVIGGTSGSDLNDVQYATLIGPAPDAYYSKLLDMGSDQIVSHMNFSNSGAKGITNLTYAVALSGTAAFGSRTFIPGALPGIDYVDNLDVCGRYMWVHFDLDDTLSASIDSGGINGRGNLLDFTIFYNPLEGIHSSLRANKSSPNIHLTWGGSQNGTSYNVLRCNAAAPPCTPVIIASPIDVSYDDPVLANSTNYWYLIQAVNGACVAP